ncbi:MAG TPA: AraC family ligand binding domain-containing protein, partial [Armatimonadota bacterium]
MAHDMTQPGASLPDAEGKSYWSTADIFAGRASAVTAFLHRDYAIGMHAHEFTEVNFVLQGRGQHYVHAQAFPTQQGDVFVIPPHEKHGYAQSEGLDVYHLLISDRFFAESGLAVRMLPGFLPLFTLEPYYRAETDFRYAMRLDNTQLAHVVALLQMMQQELAEPFRGQELAVSSLTTYLLTRLCHWYATQH